MTVMAYVLVRTKPGTSSQLVGSRRIQGVKMANSVFGPYDAVLVIVAEDLHELSRRIYEVVEKHPVVEKTETLICFPQPREERREHRPTLQVTSFHCPSCHSLVEVGSRLCYFCGYRFE